MVLGLFPDGSDHQGLGRGGGMELKAMDLELICQFSRISIYTIITN